MEKQKAIKGLKDSRIELLERALRSWRIGFWFLWTLTALIIVLSGIFIFGLQFKITVYKEYSNVLCETNNQGIELISSIYPEWADYKCKDLHIMLEDSNKAEILCREIKKIPKIDKLNCEKI